MKLFEVKAFLNGMLCALLTSLMIYIGSLRLIHFDPALYWYAVGSILAAFAVGYRFTIWAQRPPSRMYFKRGFGLLLRQGPYLLKKSQKPETEVSPTKVSLAKPELEAGMVLGEKFLLQNFIRKRSYFRWIMHLCLSGGCTFSFAITFPLVFGWVHFETISNNAELYQVTVFGMGIDQFDIHSLKAFIAFNALNFSALIVLVGLAMAAYRRITDAGERATQKFMEDLLPLILIFAVTATGLMLTVSYKFLAGQGHGFLVTVHMISVILLILYIPFGKLFHMFQRTAHLFVSLYKKAGAQGPRAHCVRCKEDYASLMHVEDLKTVLDQLDFNYRYQSKGGEEIHYQDVCPSCRRLLLAVNQGATLGR